MLRRLTSPLALLVVFACSGPPASENSAGAVTVQAPDGVEIAATVHSLGQPTVVLIHGWMCDQTYWRAQVPALAAEFGVVTVDLGGHGLSGSERESWTMALLARDAAAIITHLELTEVVVVGHSMGGRVGLEVARLLPETVISVIAVDDLHDAGLVINPAEYADLVSDLENDFASTCNDFVRSMFRQGTDETLSDPIISDMCSGPGEIGAALIRDYIAHDLGSAMRSAGVPIRCINADLWPTDVEANRRLADFDAVIFPGFGHFLMQEAPDELNDALVEMISALSE